MTETIATHTVPPATVIGITRSGAAAPVNAALPDVAVYDTFPKLLALNAATYPDEVWLREKDLGIWNAYTWKQVSARVQNIALGLLDLGVERGEVIALIGDNRPEWPMAKSPSMRWAANPWASIAMRWRTRSPTSSPMRRCG